MSTSPRRWTPCWRALARCAQRWQSLGPWTYDEIWERDSIGKTTECQGNNSSSSKNPTNQRLRWSASSGNTTKTTTRLSYISVVVPPSWKPNNNYKNKTGQRFRCSATLLEPNNNQYNNNKNETCQRLRCSATLQEERRHWRASGWRRQGRAGRPARQRWAEITRQRRIKHIRGLDIG